MVTVNDDGDDGDTVETEASVLELEDIGDTDEDFDEGDNYDHDADAFVHSGCFPKEPGGSDTFSGSASSSVHHISVEPVLGIF